MNRLVLFVLLLLFWVMLTWTAETPGPTYLQDVGVGLAVAVLVTWTMGELPKVRTVRWLEPQRFGWALAYIFVLASYIVKANLEVAYRVLHPAMPIRPAPQGPTARARAAPEADHRRADNASQDPSEGI